MINFYCFEDFPLRIAIISAYCKEPLDKIRRCHDSVASQTVKADHFLVADGNDYVRAEIDSWPVTHFKLPANHNDYGDTPRVIAALSAAAQGYDGVMLLDSDNWIEPTHVERMLATQKLTGAHVVTCPRILRRPDASSMGVDAESDGINFNDTNCYLIMAPVLAVFRSVAFKDRAQGIVGDRVLWATIRQNNIRTARSTDATVNYETTFAFHYHQIGEVPPDDAKVIAQFSDGSFRMMNWKEHKALVERQQNAK